VLTLFHPVVRSWFASRFPAGPTAPQAEGWREIAAGRHTLIAAPTGSGKTLAAFLVCIDRIYRAHEAGAGHATAAGHATVIVDEIHAVAGNKRGSHLALSIAARSAAAVSPVRTATRMSGAGRPIRAAVSAISASGASRFCQMSTASASPRCAIVEARGTIRGGRFVAGFSGEQFAHTGAVDVLRTVRKQRPAGETVRLSAADPLNLTSIVLPGPRIPAIPSNSVTYLDGAVAPGTASPEATRSAS
jgi:hypothetical protein